MFGYYVCICCGESDGSNDVFGECFCVLCISVVVYARVVFVRRARVVARDELRVDLFDGVFVC